MPIGARRDHGCLFAIVDDAGRRFFAPQRCNGERGKTTCAAEQILDDVGATPGNTGVLRDGPREYESAHRAVVQACALAGGEGDHVPAKGSGQYREAIGAAFRLDPRESQRHAISIV
jgi:hypothetical protein